jgi:hypothetical protein
VVEKEGVDGVVGREGGAEVVVMEEVLMVSRT